MKVTWLWPCPHRVQSWIGLDKFCLVKIAFASTLLGTELSFMVFGLCQYIYRPTVQQLERTSVRSVYILLRTVELLLLLLLLFCFWLGSEPQIQARKSNQVFETFWGRPPDPPPATPSASSASLTRFKVLHGWEPPPPFQSLGSVPTCFRILDPVKETVKISFSKALMSCVPQLVSTAHVLSQRWCNGNVVMNWLLTGWLDL